jgi:hypothetical protein
MRCGCWSAADRRSVGPLVDNDILAGPVRCRAAAARPAGPAGRRRRPHNRPYRWPLRGEPAVSGSMIRSSMSLIVTGSVLMTARRRLRAGLGTAFRKLFVPCSRSRPAARTRRPGRSTLGSDFHSGRQRRPGNASSQSCSGRSLCATLEGAASRPEVVSRRFMRALRRLRGIARCPLRR